MAVTGARVRVLPPLVFLLPLAAGLLLHRWAPLGLPAADPWRWAAVALVAAGLALMVWAVAVMRAARTTVIPWHEVSALVTAGPFRVSRNPIYLGDLLVYLGVTAWAGSWWPVLLLPVVLLAMTALVIGPEERYLAQRFGAAYAAYRARVRRWL